MTQDLSPPHSLKDEDIPKLVFFISGMRAGTTVFRKMMSSHPQVRDRGEIFNSANPHGFYRYCREQVAVEPEFLFPEHQAKLFLSYVASQVPKEGMVLFDVKYEHLTLITEPQALPFANPLLPRLIKRSGIKVVHLRRQHFHSVLSSIVAVQTGRFHKDKGDGPLPEKRAVAADPAAVLAAMKRRKRATDHIDNIFDDTQRLSLDYEQVFDDEGNFRGDVIERLGAFLSLDDQFEREPAMMKVIDEPLSSVISNYEEIKDLESVSL